VILPAGVARLITFGYCSSVGTGYDAFTSVNGVNELDKLNLVISFLGKKVPTVMEKSIDMGGAPHSSS
jgi:hypothetical protein